MILFDVKNQRFSVHYLYCTGAHSINLVRHAEMSMYTVQVN